MLAQACGGTVVLALTLYFSDISTRLPWFLLKTGRGPAVAPIGVITIIATEELCLCDGLGRCGQRWQLLQARE
jgi:hypothetical protein